MTGNSGIAYLKNGFGIDKFIIGIEVCYKKRNPQIHLSFKYFIQNYFFHDNPTAGVPTHGKH